jgi:hypothetical protein
MDNDKDKIITVSPGKQYVRGDTRAEKMATAREATFSAGKKRDEALDKMLREDHSPTTKAEYEEAYKKSDMLGDAYGEEVNKRYKKGGMVAKKGGGSVRGAGLAQRGQGKMRMF